MHEVRHNASPNEGMGAATASDGELAPIASFWVRIMKSCINIKRGYDQGTHEKRIGTVIVKCAIKEFVIICY